MHDYYSKVNGLPENKLVDEIEKINKRLISASPGSPTYNQLLDMLNTAQDAYHDIMIISMNKNQKDEIIEIGSIESVEYTPDYTDEELLVHVTEQYIDPTEEKKNE